MIRHLDAGNIGIPVIVVFATGFGAVNKQAREVGVVYGHDPEFPFVVVHEDQAGLAVFVVLAEDMADNGIDVQLTDFVVIPVVLFGSEKDFHVFSPF